MYYRLTKPGIVYGNVFHAIVGVLLAYHTGVTAWNSVGLIVGIALIIASACVANNILDRSIDQKMKRTRQRALVVGDVETTQAILYALILLTIGVIVMIRMTNLLTLMLSLIAYVWYVWIYGWAKRHTWWSTLIGAVPGAIPIMAGYTAIVGQVDVVVWVAFMLLVFWQMPHFYAIALYRQKEYAAAGLPVISVALGRVATYRQMVVYAAAYVISIATLIYVGGMHWTVGSLLLAAGVYWTVTIVRGKATISDTWARTVFKQSLLLTIALMLVALINTRLA